MMKTFWIVNETWDENNVGITTKRSEEYLPGELHAYNSVMYPKRGTSISGVWKEEDVFLSGCQLID